MSSLKVSYATVLLRSRESAWSAWLMAMEVEASRALSLTTMRSEEGAPLQPANWGI